MVAWTSLKEGQWIIEVAVGDESGFKNHQEFGPYQGKYIKPVLATPAPGRAWLAWECFKEGQFSIFLTKYQDGKWGPSVEITIENKSMFDPAIAEGKDGKLYLVYGVTDGVHQNIEMKILDGANLNPVDTVPVAVGGGLADRVNMNTNPALAFDKTGRLWISWENNRNSQRTEDSDCFTGDRACAMVCYENGKIFESEKQGKWLFNGINDHLPAFIYDQRGELHALTHCGGDFESNPFWKYRISSLDPKKGWSDPITIHQTSQKGQTTRPALIFEANDHCWLATRPEKWFEEDAAPEHAQPADKSTRKRLSKLELHQFKMTSLGINGTLNLKPTVVEEHHPVAGFLPKICGRPRTRRKTMDYKGETYTLLLGNLHEHTEISSCWPAGTDGTLHDDYRFGIYSEGYDFMGITDHGYSLNEVYWRKNLRMAAFYNDPPFFVGIPAMEWTLTNGDKNVPIKHAVGHKNVIFPNDAEALKFVRNKDEIYSVKNSATENAVRLWEFLHHHQVDCVTIPHHPADEVHPTDWEVHDPEYESVVEIFQCRGNAEYPGCPKEINVTRHKPIENEKAYVDYALREKKYRMGFMASGDHNSIGVGLAALWVKEVSRAGIIEALKNRRCYGTTGDKIFIDFRVNGAWGGDTASGDNNPPAISIKVEAVQPIKSLEILRNSRVIKVLEPENTTKVFDGEYRDSQFKEEEEVLYYYLRVIQDNQHIAWSSPVWVGV